MRVLRPWQSSRLGRGSAPSLGVAECKPADPGVPFLKWDQLRDSPSRRSRLDAQGLPPPPNQIAHPAASSEPQPPGGLREAGARVPPGSLAPPDVGLQQKVRGGLHRRNPGVPAHRRPARGLAGRARTEPTCGRARAARSRLQPCARARAAAARDVIHRAPRRLAAPRPSPRAPASGRRGPGRPPDDARSRLHPGRG